MTTSVKKNHLRWHKELKEFFDRSGIRWCERCGSTQPPLDMAHSRKRRMIQDRTQYMEAVLLCRRCHNEIEFSGHDNMKAEVDALIDKRGH